MEQSWTNIATAITTWSWTPDIQGRQIVVNVQNREYFNSTPNSVTIGLECKSLHTVNRNEETRGKWTLMLCFLTVVGIRKLYQMLYYPNFKTNALLKQPQIDTDHYEGQTFTL